MKELPSFPTPTEGTGVFVTQLGSPKNEGTLASPTRFLQGAIEKARIDNTVVFIAEGDYPEEIVTSVSLFGGYSTDFSSYDPVRFRTRIRSPKTGHSTTTITLQSGTPILRGLCIRGGTCSHSTAVKILKDARPLLIDNDIHGGGFLGGSYSHAVQSSWGSPAAFALIKNKLHGGINKLAWAVDGVGKDCFLSENIIDGGDGEHSWGIRGGHDFILERNSIHSGRGTKKSCCLDIYSEGTPQLIGNIFETQNASPLEAFVVGFDGAPSLRDNTINGVSDAEIFAFARKLTAQTWRFNEDPSIEKFDAVSLVPWGWLHWWGENWSGPSGGSHGGEQQSFSDFLGRGPAQFTPPDIAEEIKRILLAAGVR